MVAAGGAVPIEQLHRAKLDSFGHDRLKVSTVPTDLGTYAVYPYWAVTDESLGGAHALIIGLRPIGMAQGRSLR